MPFYENEKIRYMSLAGATYNRERMIWTIPMTAEFIIQLKGRTFTLHDLVSSGDGQVNLWYCELIQVSWWHRIWRQFCRFFN